MQVDPCDGLFEQFLRVRYRRERVEGGFEIGEQGRVVGVLRAACRVGPHQVVAHLVEHGVLVKVPYSEHPPRHDYRLTDKGRDLWPVITTLRQWGDRYAAPDGPPLQLIHNGCGETADTRMVCQACGQPIGPRDVKAIPGPGAVEPLVHTAAR